MNLSHSQKKYLKKSLKKIGLSKVAENLKVSENEILQYLKNNWPKEKYQNFLKNQRKDNIPKSPLLLNLEEKNKNFNFKNFFLQNWKVFLFLTILVLGIYANTLKNVFLSDDIFGIVENKNIGNFGYYLTNQPMILLRPFFSFLIYKISGLNVIPYHLLNIFFHLGSVWLIYIIISFLTTPLLAFFTASLFAAHPLLTESVTWISGGPYTQYSFFLLLAFWFYLLYKNRHQIKNCLFSLLFFLLAMLTTEKAVVFPLILWLFEFSFGQLRKNWKKLIPFFVLAFVWSLLFIIQGAVKGRITSLETQYYQASGMENPLVQIPIAISSYLQLFLWPDKLTLYHSELTFSNNEYLLRMIITLIYLVIILWAYLKKNRFLLFSLAFFIIVLLPTLTPLKLGWVVAERYVYLASLGLFLPLAWLLTKLERKTRNKKIVFIIFFMLLIALSARTVIRNIDWKNQDNLWLSASRASPSSHQNHNNLGDMYARHGDYQKAIEEFQKAIELKPDYGDAYHNLANVYHQTSRDDLALENYQKALSFNPNLWQSYQNLAAIYFSQAKLELAKESMEKAIKINPENTELHTNLGIIYLKLNEKQKAKEEFEKTLQIDPQNQKAKQQLELIK